MRIERKRIVSFVLVLCLFMSLQIILPASAKAETEITKVLTQISHEPVALMEIQFVSATTTTPGCTLTSAAWFDSKGNAVSTYFDTGIYRLELKLTANEGYVFAESVAAYVNNTAVEASLDDTRTSLTITRDYTPMLWQPTVIKHPGAETVNEGEWTSFVATATYTSDYDWSFVDTGGKSVSAADIATKFPNVSVNGNGSGKIIVYNIPYAMNGWKVVCTFSGPGGSIASNGAVITVKADPAKQTPSPSPSPSPSASPSPEQHEHEFPEQWMSDDAKHWKQCECGENGKEAVHSFTWTVTRAATKAQPGEATGVCSACGYTELRAEEYTENNEAGEIPGLRTFRWILVGLFAVLALIIAVLIIQNVKEKKRRRKHRRR